MHMLRVGRQAAQVKSSGRMQDAKGLWQSFQSCIDGGISPVQTVSTMGKETVPGDVSDLLRLRDHFASTLIGLIVLRPKTYSRRWATKQTVSFPIALSSSPQ